MNLKPTIHRGFTLVELLVVMSIIGLLVALLLPAIANARESARLVECQSREKQIYYLCTIYRQDYGSFYPACHFYKGTDPNVALFFGPLIRPYMPKGMDDIYSYNFTYKTNMLLCPNTKYRYYTNPVFTAAAGAWPHIYAGQGYETGYEVAMQFGGGNDDSWTTAATQLQYRPKKEIWRPSTIAYMSEVAGNSPYLFYTSAGGIKYNHLNGNSVNVTMNDGQVKAYHEDLNTAMARTGGDPRRLVYW
jgi:prepilin-type N-terminal cleavage/methylation domain-containing protein